MSSVQASVYQCEVWHQRLVPLRRAFRYKVFMLSFDLDSLSSIVRQIPILSQNRFNLYSVNDEDHIDLGEPGGIRPNLERWLSEQGHELPEGVGIQLVTFPRVLGYGFNPVSFYYLTSSSGEPLGAVAEVVNTFREMKLYYLDQKGIDGRWQRRIDKDFYVSPFSDSGDVFDFQLGSPQENLAVNIDNWTEGEKSLVSSVQGSQKSLTTARLLWFAVKYPFLSLQIIGGIHWQAFRLWLAKVPFFRKTERLEAQRDVLRPHSSLTRK